MLIPYPRSYQRLFYCLLFAWCLNSAGAQVIFSNPVLPFNEKDLSFNHEIETDPVLLSKALTENKKSEKEKFDAIFSWVATKIDYDYGAYFAPGGTYSRIQNILRRKSALCIGYAELMDTLCHVAGIQNISVFGYAKDHLFDPGDSLYIDNHAWNAVKLDGEWYVYDVTWSTGEPEYTMTRFSRWKEKLLKKAAEKYKMKKVKRKHRFFERRECGKEHKPVYYYKQKFFNKLYLRFLRRLTVYLHPGYNKSLRTDFYLCNPEVFAITHFPDDPIWSLSKKNSISRFERDSAFYFLNDTVYKNQIREGRECLACDEYYESDNYRKNLILKRNSYRGNPKNPFIQGACSYSLAFMNVAESKALSDSASRIKLIDSALFRVAQSKINLKASKVNAIKEFKQLTSKNNKKLKILLAENAKHKKFISVRVRSTDNSMRYFRRMFSRSNSCYKDYHKRAALLMKYNPANPKSKPNIKLYKIIATGYKITRKQRGIDSIIIRVGKLREEFNVEMEALSLNAWVQTKNHDSLLGFFAKTIWLRSNEKDNFKKDVFEVRTTLQSFEDKYSNHINKSVYFPSERLKYLHKEILRLLNIQYGLERDCIRLKRDLVKWDEMSAAEFRNYRDEIHTRRRDDYCWLDTYIPYMFSIMKSFEILRIKQRTVIQAIHEENKTERGRHYKVNREYLRRDKKHKNIINGNLRLINVSAKEYSKYRRSITNPRKKKKR